MSLQVWLPLNGDLHNQGLNPITSTSTAYTVENSGKIGTCIKCTTSQLNTGITAANWDFTATSISFGGWIKITQADLQARTSSTTYDSTYNSAGGTLMGYDSYGGLGLRWKTNNIYSAGSLTSVSLYVHIRNSGGSSVSTSSYTLPFGVWTHVIVSLDREKQTLNLYINGSLFNSKSCAVATYAASGNVTQNTFLFNQSSWDGGNGRPMSVPWQINDFRLYDHALSAKEVEEIAKGLVLHYKLDYSNPNLLSKYVTPGQAAPGGTATAGRTNYYGDYGIIIPAAENADTYFRLFLKQQLTQNTVYTISCYVSGLLPGSQYNFPLFSQGNASMGVLSLNHNGICSLTFTMNSSTQTSVTAPDGSTVYICFMDDSARTLASGQGAITVTGFKIEQGNIATPFNTGNASVIYDSSGYSHNGTIVGTLTAAAGSPRYDVATHLESSSPTTNNNTGLTYIQSPLGLTAPMQMSVCWWGRPESGYGGTSNHAAWCTSASSGDPTDYNQTAFHHRDAKFDICLNSASRTSLSLTFNNYTLNEWHYYCVTYDGKIAISYKDGIETNRSTISSAEAPLKTFTKIVIGFSKAGGVWRKTLGSYSDFRVYATALTPNQVKELYNTSMSIDSNSNVYARELSEL